MKRTKLANAVNKRSLEALFIVDIRRATESATDLGIIGKKHSIKAVSPATRFDARQKALEKNTFSGAPDRLEGSQLARDQQPLRV